MRQTSDDTELKEVGGSKLVRKSLTIFTLEKNQCHNFHTGANHRHNYHTGENNYHDYHTGENQCQEKIVSS